MIVAVCALGIAQITAWGTSYYCLGVLAGPIAADTGWSRSLVYFGFTVALLAMGLVSAWAGRAHRPARRARRDERSASCSFRPGLYALAQVRTEAAYLAVWAAIGVGMRFCLYDAAFAALVQIVPARGRQAISYLTLFGAFASIGVLGARPLPQRGLRLAPHARCCSRLINAGVCLPLNLAGLARREARAAGGAADAGARATRPTARRCEGRARTIAIALFAADHVAQRLRVRRGHGAAGAAARGRGPGRRRGGLGRLAQGLRAVRRPRGGDLLRPQPARDHRGAHRHRRAAAVVPAAAARAAATCRRSSPSRC